MNVNDVVLKEARTLMKSRQNKDFSVETHIILEILNCFDENVMIEGFESDMLQSMLECLCTE